MPAFHKGAGIVGPLIGTDDPEPMLRKLGWDGQPGSAPQWYNYHWYPLADQRFTGSFQPMIKHVEMALEMRSSLCDALMDTDQAWLYLNEPDIHNQSPCAPVEAVRGLIKIREFMAKNGKPFRWMGPNTDNSQGWGQAWLQQFLYLLRLYEMDLPEAWGVHNHWLVHDYRGRYIWDSFDAWWDGFHAWMHANDCVRQVILTELSAEAHAAPVQVALLKHAKMRAADMSPRFYNFQGFFWFSTRYDMPRWDGDLMDKWGALTTIGKAYVRG